MSEPGYVRAASVGEAIAALEQAGGAGLVVAGGTVVASLFNQRLAAPDVLVDISRIADLRRIETLPDGGLAIGALATHDDILRSPDIREAAPLLSEIAADISCARLRSRGTLGGNLCTIGSQGDAATGLIALGARQHLRGPAGERTLTIEGFYEDAFKADIAADEILETVGIPRAAAGTRFGFCKLAPRKAMDWTQISASVALVQGGGVIERIRIGMNGVANSPNRPRGVERLMTQSGAGGIDWNAVADTLDGEISPQGDLVYSEPFKRRLAVVALRRAVESARAPSVETGGGAR